MDRGRARRCVEGVCGRLEGRDAGCGGGDGGGVGVGIGDLVAAAGRDHVGSPPEVLEWLASSSATGASQIG